MSENNKSYRIKANINQDTVLKVNLNQDYNIFEVLSLKVTKSQLYKMHTSKYGCVVGRVLGNGNFGIPNAKVSVFVEVSGDTLTDTVLGDLYPYASVNTANDDGVRYNLLPDEKVSSCHAQVGTFPNKRLVLDDDNVLEIFDKYYRYTTRTNDAGDYMIFGVPVGQHILHTDIDLSDIGILSQKPRDLIAQGYNINQFENANQFKRGTDLDNLSQIITQNISIDVKSFWGDNGVDDDDTVAITRQDVTVEYKFQPTCVFMGSIVSDEKSNGISKECIATDDMGEMRHLTTGNGTIEMVRKTPTNDVEELRIEGTQLIDGNGTWCYNIPMNLDYMMTDEYGNMVPTDDPSKGIPTRTRARFRFSLSDFDSDYSNNHLAKVLVPNNPKDYNDLDYAFGTNTKDDTFATKSFRDLFWNNVYTVKSYIPRIQNGDGNSRNFTGIKRINVNGSNNPLPYNNIRIQLSFSYVLQCAMLKCLIKVVSIMNKIIGLMKKTCCNAPKGCITVGDGICPDLENWYFAPGCGYLEDTLNYVTENDKNPEVNDQKSIDGKNMDSEVHCITKKVDYLMQCIEVKLALETDTIEFDFFNDWINGMLYIPRWFVKIRRKRSILFGLVHIKQKMKSCMDDMFYRERRLVQQCSLEYMQDSNRQYSVVTSRIGCRKKDSKLKCHKGSGRGSARIFRRENKNGGGIVHGEPTIKKQTVYYFKPTEWIYDGGRYVKANLFATDIVLLGSLNECDKYGLPQAFKSLSSSSFKMPTALALTNLQTNGFMYGHKTKGVYCDGVNNDGIQVFDNTYAGYKEWASGTEFAANVDYDVNDYAVTESSGIDWGYSGPGQGKNDNKMYNPGGHFLGISCFAAQTNVKSCINLARVCEVGADISQRQPLVVKSNQGPNRYLYAYLIPTGVITKIDLSDNDFRRMFATLNYNNLKTAFDDVTQTLKYDIIPLNVNNFNGELSKTYLSSSEYNISKPKSDNTEVKIGENEKDKLFVGDIEKDTPNAPAYTYTVDTKSSDYYSFRFGLKNGEDAKTKYLKAYGNVVSMPVYENSYYFYFGLKDGDTAFDRFLTNYFSPCDDDESIYPVIEVNTVNCIGYYSVNKGFVLKQRGTANVEVHNLMAPYTVTITTDIDCRTSMKVSDDSGDLSFSKVINDGIWSYGFTTEYNEFKIEGLPAGTYGISIHNTTESIEKVTFNITEEEMDEIKNIDVIPYDYSKEVDNYVIDKDKGGYFNVIQNNEILPVVISDINNCCLYYSGSKYETIDPIVSDGTLTGLRYPDKDISLDGAFNGLSYIGDTLQLEKKDSNYYVWCGNNNYTVSVVKRTKDSVEVFKLGEFSISMPSGFDYYIGHPLITGKRLEPFIFTTNGNVVNVTEDWLPNVLNSKGVFTSTEKEILKTQLTYQKGKDKQSITVGCINGTLPYSIEVCGNGERSGGSGAHMFVEIHQFDTEEKNVNDGFSLSLDSFQLPTEILPTEAVKDKYNNWSYVPVYKYPYLVYFGDANTVIDTGTTYNYETINRFGKINFGLTCSDGIYRNFNIGGEIEIYLTLYIESAGHWNDLGMEEGMSKYELQYAGYTVYLEITSYKINNVVYDLSNHHINGNDYELDLTELNSAYPECRNYIKLNVLFNGANDDIDYTSFELDGSIVNAKSHISVIDLPTTITLIRSFKIKSCLWLPKFTNVKVVVNKQAKICDYRNNPFFGLLTNGTPGKQFRESNSKTIDITINDSDDPTAEKLSLESSSTTFVQEQGKKYIPLHCLIRGN